MRRERKYPGCMTVAYVNTTAELKAVADVCVTSSSAAEIVKKLPAKDICSFPTSIWAPMCRRAVRKRNCIFSSAAVPCILP